jgi:Na+/proline symporter
MLQKSICLIAIEILRFIASNQLSPCNLLMFSPVFQKDKHRPLAPQENAMKTEMRILLFLVVLLLVITLLSCTAGPNVLKGSSGANNVVAGFWRGLWHGLIFLFTMIASLFSNSDKDGGWYFGFVLGAAMFFGCKAGGRGAKTIHSDCSS